MDEVTISVDFTVDRKDLLDAAGMVSTASLIEAMCFCLQDGMYDNAEGPMLKGNFHVQGVKE